MTHHSDRILMAAHDPTRTPSKRAGSQVNAMRVDLRGRAGRSPVHCTIGLRQEHRLMLLRSEGLAMVFQCLHCHDRWRLDGEWWINLGLDALPHGGEADVPDWTSDGGIERSHP